jgi:molecular chaperone GrpE (heat shock protein)
MTDQVTEERAALRDLAARLDDLTREVRRQGRAAVAAQAAAESCLAKLAEGPGVNGRGDEPSGEGEGATAADVAWAEALLPVADALDRVLSQANAMAEHRLTTEAPRGGFWSILGRAPREVRGGRASELGALAEGLRVLRSQLGTALESCGLTADRRIGVSVDPEVHRVVEVRATRPGERDGIVLEVIRPGYAAHGRVVREAEVVATANRGTVRGDG